MRDKEDPLKMRRSVFKMRGFRKMTVYCYMLGLTLFIGQSYVIIISFLQGISCKI